MNDQVVQEPVRAEDLKHANGIAVVGDEDRGEQSPGLDGEAKTETPTQEG